MLDVREIARDIYRVALGEEQDLIQGGLLWPGVTLNLFVIQAEKPCIIQTGLRRAFARLRDRVREVVEPMKLRYIVVPHHEGDSSGALNEWEALAPQAEILCSELCASLNLRDFSDREPRVVKDGQVVDLGTHRLRFFMTSQVNQWDSLMLFEETTGTLFPNDLFSSLGLGAVTCEDTSRVALEAARQLGYQPNDPSAVGHALDKIAGLLVKVLATMHGPTVIGQFDKLVRTFRDNSLTA